MADRIIWIEKLTFFSGVLACMAGLRHRSTMFHYARVSAGGRALLLILRYVKAGEIFSNVLPNMAGRSKSGHALWYDAEHLNTQAVDALLATLRVPVQRCLPDALANHEERILLALGAFITRFSLPCMRFLVSAAHAPETLSNNLTDPARYWISSFPFARQIARSIAASIPGEIRVLPCARNTVMFFFPVLYVLGFANVLAASFHKIRRKELVGGNISPREQGKIIVEFYGRRFIDRRMPNMFWHSAGIVPRSRICMFFHRRDARPSRDNKQRIENMGLSWIDLYGPSLYAHLDTPLRTYFHCAFTVFPFALTSRNLFLKSIIFFFFFNVLTWRNVYSKYGIRMLQQFNEHPFRNHIQILALNMEGGASIWFHWSMDRIPFSHYNYAYQDIIFTWGKLNTHFIDYHDIKYKYQFQIGMPFGNTLEKEQVSFIKESFSNECSLVICLFDNAAAPQLPHSEEMLQTFYNCLLGSILHHPGWGAVIKPRDFTADMIASTYGQDVRIKMNKLKKQGRLAILDSTVTPLSAAAASDISVGCSINSAAAQAGYAGFRAAHWDLAGKIQHPLAQLAPGTLYFNSFSQLEQALEQFETDKNGPIGDHKPINQWLDIFLDGKAPERASAILEEFLDNSENKDPDLLIASIAAKYEQKWGAGTATPFKAPRASCDNNLWMQSSLKTRSGS